MAREFDNVDDSASLGAASVLQITGDISVACYCYRTSGSQGHLLGCYNPNNPFTGWSVARESTAHEFKYWSDGNGAWRLATTAVGTTWEHRAVVVAGTGAGAGTFYLNGSTDGTFTQTAPGEFTGTKRLGSRGDATAARFWNGGLAHVAVWNIALSAAEIEMHRRGFLPRANSLVGYWPLFGTVSPEPDWSGNNNHGTLTGTTQIDHPPGISAIWLAPHPRLSQVAAETPKLVYQPWYHRAPVLAQ